MTSAITVTTHAHLNRSGIRQGSKLVWEEKGPCQSGKRWGRFILGREGPLSVWEEMGHCQSGERWALVSLGREGSMSQSGNSNHKIFSLLCNPTL